MRNWASPFDCETNPSSWLLIVLTSDKSPDDEEEDKECCEKPYIERNLILSALSPLWVARGIHCVIVRSNPFLVACPCNPAFIVFGGSSGKCG